jgi:tetratricopeptide (TPR) repeat protein
MADVDELTVRFDAQAFMGAAPDARTALLALSAAESLTDDVARLLTEATTPSLDADRFIRALHTTDFVLERNSEWQLASDVRQTLSKALASDVPRNTAAHRVLLGLAAAREDEITGIEVPRYLRRPVGHAYHTAFFLPTAALFEYAALAREALTGETWLAAELAREQQAIGILPSDAIQVDFLVGMWLWKEGRRAEAEPVLRRVAEANLIAPEVAISAHLVGAREGLRARQRHHGERLLARSLEILIQLRDRFGEAQVLHTLGLVIGRDQERRREAEDLLQQSLAIGQELKNLSHQAMVLHTLGRLIGRDQRRRAEAEDLLRQSLEREGDEAGRAQVLHTLGQLVGRDRRRKAEAEDLLRESLTLERGHDVFGKAQVLHTLGQLIGRDPTRETEAEDLLRQSLALGLESRNLNHQAQVYRTLGQLIGRNPRRKAEAERALRRSLEINEARGDAHGIALVQQSLRDLNISPGSDVSEPGLEQ